MPLALQRRTQGYFPCRAALADNAVALTTTVSNSIALVLNAAPTSTSVTPMDGTTFTAPANVTLSATASDSDGSISQVDFYNGTTLIGTVLSGSAGDTGSGYTATWSNVAPGTYQLTAKATDNNGARVTTAAVTVTVNATAATIYYIHPDHLGTPRAITTSDATNTKVWDWGNSDAFGNNVPNEDPSATGTAFKYNLRFGRGYYDAETATMYMYFRDYDPALGRFPQSDPIGLAAGLNTYAYVGGRPLDFIDPFGLAPGGVPYLNPQRKKPTCACSNIVAYQADVDKKAEGGTEYGHHWIEIGSTESYGYWPTGMVSLSGTVMGVAGSVNRGRTNDPHQGDRSGNPASFPLNTYGPESQGQTCEQICRQKAQCIRDFASSYTKNYGSEWSYRLEIGDNNCHTFQRRAFNSCELSK